jgi:uracil-DNA glycosylase
MLAVTPPPSPLPHVEPPRDCPLCPRLVAFREDLRVQHPDWWNAPVPHFGDPEAWVAIAGLAPGMWGANRTGRPFTGDYAGELLYSTLLKFGLAEGRYGADPADGLRLTGARITNAVRCVPPENRPTPLESATCRRFLAAEIAAMPKLRAVLALGSIAHASVLSALGEKQARFPFGHGAQHALSGGLLLADSYHCSRLNTNTGRLTEAMFHQVFADVVRAIFPLSGPGAAGGSEGVSPTG